MPRILIVDDHEIVRMGLRTLLASYPDYQVCGEAADGPHAIAEVAKSAPDVVILDVLLQGDMTGFDAAERIREIAPSVKMIFFSLHDVPATARQVGGHAFVSKASKSGELLATIARVVGRKSEQTRHGYPLRHQ